MDVFFVNSALCAYHRYLKSAVITLIFILSACATLIPETNRNLEKSKRYSHHLPGINWKNIDKDKSDFALMHSTTGAIITGNTICKKYTSTTLNDLAGNMFSGVTDLMINSKMKVQMFNRNTLVIDASGSIDGVIISINSYTLKRNRCIYDFILIYPSIEIPVDIKRDMVNFMEKIKID